MKKIALLAALLALAPLGAQAQSVPAYTFPGINIFSGGTASSLLTSSSPTACTSLQINASGTLGYLRVIDWAGAATGTRTITFFDEGAAPTCAAGDAVYAVVNPVVNTPIKPDIILYNGLAYTLSGALTANLYIGRN